MSTRKVFGISGTAPYGQFDDTVAVVGEKFLFQIRDNLGFVIRAHDIAAGFLPHRHRHGTPGHHRTPVLSPVSCKSA
jgi:hypothetical protein